MTNEEKVLLGIALAGLAAVVIFQRRPVMVAEVAAMTDPVVEIGQSLTPNNTSVAKGPSYLSYNTPWAFAPPVSNFLPTITAGQVGQTVENPTDFQKSFYDAGCGCA